MKGTFCSCAARILAFIRCSLRSASARTSRAFRAATTAWACSLKAQDIRAEADLSEQRMNAKIRVAQEQKVPYMLILGEKEKTAGTLSVRTRAGEQFSVESVAKFAGMVHDRVKKLE